MINIKKLTKSYKVKGEKYYVFRDFTVQLPSDRSIAVIGRNGAGKTTLLRMIGGIDRADSGEIVTDKTISWPVGLAGGFQGSLSGRENVKFVARLYSDKSEINQKIEFIEQFTELGRYFDMPIKSYSSGMRARLGFGLSMAFHFDYYLVDEVIAVGDARFKQKCSELFLQKSKESNFLMVSHSLNQLKQYCDAALFIGRDNNVLYYDNIDEAIFDYKSAELE